MILWKLYFLDARRAVHPPKYIMHCVAYLLSRSRSQDIDMLNLRRWVAASSYWYYVEFDTFEMNQSIGIGYTKRNLTPERKICALRQPLRRID